MPEFSYKGKIYFNPVEFALRFIGGTWKMPILWRLKDKTFRYSELKASIRHISDKMLAKQLKELEADGFIERNVFAEVPPRTEYIITERGRKAIPLIEHLREFGFALMKEEGIYEK